MADSWNAVKGLERSVSLRPYTTLRAGGHAEWLYTARTADELAQMAALAHKSGVHVTTLGSGSNILPSDAGVPGLVLLNQASEVRVQSDGEVVADTGCSFQELFLKTAQRGLAGLEFAVGIPGTLGGALVSNAGAYRSNVSEFVTELDVVVDGDRRWVPATYMRFSYRDSLLRCADPPQRCLVRVRMRLPQGDSQRIYDEARDYQRKRIGKQPAPASAGSFFKNVEDRTLAASLPGLPPSLRDAGVVPAGYLIEAAGLKGYRLGGAQIAPRHANFILNVRDASATEIRRLAEHVKAVVCERFGVRLEEEVMYLGDWSGFVA